MGTNRPMARVPAGLRGQRGQRGSAGPAGPPEFPGATGSVGSNGVSAVLGDSKGQWAFPMQLDVERVARNVVGVIRHMLIQHGSLKPMAQPLVLPSKPKKEVNLVTCQGLHTGRATRAGSRTAPGLVWAPGPVTRPRPGGRPPQGFSDRCGLTSGTMTPRSGVTGVRGVTHRTSAAQSSSTIASSSSGPRSRPSRTSSAAPRIPTTKWRASTFGRRSGARRSSSIT